MRRWMIVTAVALMAAVPAAGYAQAPSDKMKDDKMKMDDKMKDDKMKMDDKMKHDKMMKDDKAMKDDKMKKDGKTMEKK